ncbi:hypothetical protein K443DRAFT_552632 [Laccaria amethystina LaAM-08-1]|jgi:L-rhamnose isomerase|uniref:Uncharacterized protein n=1 Tax=Laccaria amethystina LaAM-08-1 TaxID=1095629 RepID=A0A0C9XJL0_9AGAR|nr:hypothetical protein K443DRAFT_552632 [Laccaria amethystina LaAM-08-1]
MPSTPVPGREVPDGQALRGQLCSDSQEPVKSANAGRLRKCQELRFMPGAGRLKIQASSLEAKYIRARNQMLGRSFPMTFATLRTVVKCPFGLR